MKQNATTRALFQYLLSRAFEGLNVTDDHNVVLNPQFKKKEGEKKALDPVLDDKQPQDMSTQQGCSWQRSEVTHVSVSREK